jgi:hypothetical protein
VRHRGEEEDFGDEFCEGSGEGVLYSNGLTRLVKRIRDGGRVRWNMGNAEKLLR